MRSRTFRIVSSLEAWGLARPRRPLASDFFRDICNDGFAGVLIRKGEPPPDGDRKKDEREDPQGQRDYSTPAPSRLAGIKQLCHDRPLSISNSGPEGAEADVVPFPRCPDCNRRTGIAA